GPGARPHGLSDGRHHRRGARRPRARRPTLHRHGGRPRCDRREARRGDRFRNPKRHHRGGFQMKIKMTAWATCAALSAVLLVPTAFAQQKYLTIGTGGVTGVYYAA